jgi:hypothetical protein
MAVKTCGQNGMILPDGTIANQRRSQSSCETSQINIGSVPT